MTSYFIFCAMALWCGPAFAEVAIGDTGGDVSIPDAPGTQEAGSVQAPVVIPDLGGSDIPVIFPGQPGETPGEFPAPETGKAETPAEWADSPDGISEFERFLTGALPEEHISEITRYGSEFFRSAPSTFAPDEGAPVSPDYVIGPGDQIRIDVRDHTIDLLVDEAILAERLADLKHPEPRYTSGFLAKYAALAAGAEYGAVTQA